MGLVNSSGSFGVTVQQVSGVSTVDLVIAFLLAPFTLANYPLNPPLCFLCEFDYFPLFLFLFFASPYCTLYAQRVSGRR